MSSEPYKIFRVDTRTRGVHHIPARNRRHAVAIAVARMIDRHHTFNADEVLAWIVWKTL